MIFEILLLVLSVPVGFVIAWLARDELVEGKKWFRVLFIISLVGIIGFRIYGFSYISWTFGFIGIVSLISLVKSEDKKWISKRI